MSNNPVTPDKAQTPNDSQPPPSPTDPTLPNSDSTALSQPEPSDEETAMIMEEFDNHQNNNQPPPKQLKNSQHVASNLRTSPAKPASINVGMFTSVSETQSAPDLSRPPSIQDQNKTGDTTVSKIQKNIITFRYKLKIANNTCNLPFIF